MTVVGIGSYAYRWALRGGDGIPGISPEELVDDAASLGSPVLQIADHPVLDEGDLDLIARLAGRAAAQGMRLQTGFSGLTADRLARHLDVAVAARADVVRVVPHDAGVDPDPDRIVDLLRSAVPQLEREGIRIGIENHFTMPSERLRSIVERVDSDRVGVVLDVANSIMCGEWPSRTIELLAPVAVNVHVKDYRIVPDADGVGGHVVGAPLGDGWTDVDGLLDRFGIADDDALVLVVEQWCPAGSGFAATVRAERTWRTAGFRRLVEAHRARTGPTRKAETAHV
jgi:3-oxoisoapionate decarboxylase